MKFKNQVLFNAEYINLAYKPTNPDFWKCYTMHWQHQLVLKTNILTEVQNELGNLEVNDPSRNNKQTLSVYDELNDLEYDYLKFTSQLESVHDQLATWFGKKESIQAHVSYIKVMLEASRNNIADNACFGNTTSVMLPLNEWVGVMVQTSKEKLVDKS